MGETGHSLVGTNLNEHSLRGTATLDYVDLYRMCSETPGREKGGSYKRSDRKYNTCQGEGTSSQNPRIVEQKSFLPMILLFLLLSLSSGNQKQKNELWEMRRRKKQSRATFRVYIPQLKCKEVRPELP